MINPNKNFASEGRGAGDKGIKHKNKQKTTHKQTTVGWLPEGKGVGEVEEGKGGINGDGRRLDLGWRTHNTVYMIYYWTVYLQPT